MREPHTDPKFIREAGHADSDFVSDWNGKPSAPAGGAGNRNGKPRKSLLGQLTQRKVTRVAVAYIVVGWLLMQVGEVTFESLTLPPWALTLLIVLVLLGFPIALVLAWAYEVTPDGIREDLAGTVSAAENSGDYLLDTGPSIAVLPFYDMSEHRDQGYFCEGIAEEILNSLCKVENLGVASRVASFQFGGKRADITEIGKKLRVQTILEGTVRKHGDKLRITVQLVKTSDGYHLWSRQYDRALEDVFDIQGDIADSIASVLSVTLNHEYASANKPVDPKATEFLLRGNSLFARHNIQDIVHARQMFNRALELNPDDNRALNAGAFALLRLGKNEEAEEWMKCSIRSAPTDSIIHYNAACFYALQGNTEKALECLENCLVKAGNVKREWLERDSDLDSVRDHPRFPEIIASFSD